ncbi:two-component response regulator ORR24-like [Cucurbita maxima]|uniref:Two-component response regulator n=1 Tax=Cucurbita maxima TaxID=3661 RepID=A0A6J1HKU7_CUCMA|nr:two-component response regulator ORR24-like [Cucurbita maxima]XP_022965633.1 two-component response regulator ORR24-like [Cucurbita maxima]XP_022965634.1 two-component response regulator ORR24-like [Cucurbita maxima]
MTVEDRRANLVGENGVMDQFPIGMRVLAVDDDPICLKVLENLLRKCQYHVTTTNQAIQALKMLRENRNKFDLVISDVNMPDMDGFKLLELVGLEMDLPVIMLSAHSDTELVKKGVFHGACDYLLKPVRIEELKNIWQHVLRRKTSSAKNQNECTNGNDTLCQTVEVVKGFPSAASADNGKPGKRRKDDDDDEEGGEEESAYETDDSSSQKKQRVVWFGELHRKFIAAVNHLGYEKAVPKKILDLMNVEGLTRENVASHLQKYRQYLKKMCTKEAQQCNMMAAFGGKDTSFRPMASLNGFSMTGTGRLSNATFSSYPSQGIVGRLNSTAGLSLHGIASSGMIQQGASHNLRSSLNILRKPHPTLLLSNRPPSIFNSISTPSDHIQSHWDKHNAPFKESNLINDVSSFTVSTSFPDARVAVGCSSNYDFGVSSHSLMLQGHKQQSHGSGEFRDQSCYKVSPINPEPVDCSTGISNILGGHGQSNKNWQGVSLTGTYPSDGMPAINLTISSAQPDNENFPVGFPSTSVDSSSQLDLRGETQCYDELMDRVVDAMNDRSKQQWETAKQNYYGNHSSILRNSLVSGNSVADPLDPSSADPNDVICLENIGSSLTNQLNSDAPAFIQQDAETLMMETWMNFDGKSLMDPTKLHYSFSSLDE